MTASVLTAGTQIPADPRAPIRFDFELHALRMAFVEPANVNRLTDEWQQPGVYVLLGKRSAEQATDVYVGMATDLRKRLTAHRRKPKFPWWRAVAVVRDTTTGFDSAQIGYLEGRLAQELRVLPGVNVREGMSTMDVTLPTFARSPLDEFVGTVLEALRIAGVDLQSGAEDDPESETVTSGRGHTMIPGTIKDLLGAGLLDAGSRLVAEREVGGKQIRLECEVSASGELIFEGVAYRNPTRPAVLGFDLKSTNGWVAWKTDGGKTLADLRDQLPPGSAS